MQSLASAILAPSLRLVADRLALQWRKQLTRRVHSKYLSGTNFYATSQLANLQVSSQKPTHSTCASEKLPLLEYDQNGQKFCS